MGTTHVEKRERKRTRWPREAQKISISMLAFWQEKNCVCVLAAAAATIWQQEAKDYCLTRIA